MLDCGMSTDFRICVGASYLYFITFHSNIVAWQIITKFHFWTLERGSDLGAHGCPSRFWMDGYCKGNWEVLQQLMSWFQRKPHGFCFMLTPLLVPSVTNNNANLTFWIVARGSDLVAHSCPTRFWVHRYCKGNWKKFCSSGCLDWKGNPMILFYVGAFNCPLSDK